jgi:hypothetical protein
MDNNIVAAKVQIGFSQPIQQEARGAAPKTVLGNLTARISSYRAGGKYAFR